MAGGDDDDDGGGPKQTWLDTDAITLTSTHIHTQS